MKENSIITFLATNSAVVILFCICSTCCLVYFIYKKLTKIFEYLDFFEKILREHYHELKEINETSYSIKKNHEHAIDASRKLRLILTKYKGKEFDTKAIKDLSSRIDESLTGRNEENKIIPKRKSEHEEYKSIELLGLDNKEINEKIENLNNSQSFDDDINPFIEKTDIIKNKIGEEISVSQKFKNRTNDIRKKLKLVKSNNPENNINTQPEKDIYGENDIFKLNN